MAAGGRQEGQARSAEGGTDQDEARELSCAGETGQGSASHVQRGLSDCSGSDRWQGPRYEVYRSYRPEHHDQSWYRSRYQRVELIAGGYYYFNSGYWYPAWGYNSANEYYAYDAPIYVGKRAEPPDKVIANVQAVLQEMGYYKGEVDGLLGPLTREALTGYQTDTGMTVTAVIDQPTLDALGMG